jgi:hypothetical protein
MAQASRPVASGPNGWYILQALQHSLFDLALPIGIVILITLLVPVFHTLFPARYWQSHSLDRNLVKWDGAHIDHYRMLVYLQCATVICDSVPLAVEVSQGQVLSVVDATGRSLAPADEPRRSFPFALTIPGLFSEARGAIRDQYSLTRITYDPKLGYPTSIYIVPSNPKLAEMGFGVQHLQVLSP